MKRVHLLFLMLAIVFLASVSMSQLTEQGSLLYDLALFPGMASLFGAVYELLNDRLKFERSVILQERQNSFNLGASSHMANTAFDKHVQFSEEYVGEVYKTLKTLFREGPTKTAVQHANKLSEIRQKYFVWLTADIDSKFEKFEKSLRQLGAHAGLELQGYKPSQEFVTRLYHKFSSLLGSENIGSDNWEGVALDEDAAIEKVIVRFRKILGTEELTTIREALLKNALDSLK